MGYTRQWILGELEISDACLRKWIHKGLFRGLNPGSFCGRGCMGYSPAFLARGRVIHQWLQYWPRGPLENLRDQLYREDDE